MRHLTCATLFAVALIASLAVLDAIGRRHSGPGVVWIVTSAPAHTLARWPGRPELRLMDAWIGGHVLLVHAAALDQVTLDDGASWIVVRGSVALTLPACG